MIELSILSGRFLIVLLDASIKALALAVLAALGLGVVRVRSPSLRHAVWAMVLCGMLSMPFLSLALPGVVLPLLPTTVGPAGCEQGPPLADSSFAEATPSTPVRELSQKNATLSAENPTRPVAASASQPLLRATWPVVPLSGYVAGLIIFLARFLLGLAGCRRLVRGAIWSRWIA